MPDSLIEASPNHPVVALWVHPRSMSTAVERIMRERGDLQCFHEPFMYYYYVHLGTKTLKHFDIDPDQPTSFDGIVRTLVTAAEHRPVFFKDMGYYVLPGIYDHETLAKQMRHVFLVRDPRRSIISYHKLDPDMTCDEIGIAAQWELFEWLRGITGVEPPVIQAESIQQHLEQVMGELWERLGLPYVKGAFTWQSQKLPDDWRSVAGWHESVKDSSGIRRAVGDRDVAKDFVVLVAQHPRMQSYLDYHWPYYEKLKSVASADA